MRVLDRTVFIGANVYALYPVIRLRLDLGALEEWPSARLGEPFIGPLLAALPGLATHGCSYGVPGGFVRRLREGEGTWMGHILEHVALELQHLTGATVTFGKTRSTGRPGEYDLVYAYEDEEVGLRAGELAEGFLRSILPAELHGVEPDAAFDLRREVDGLVAAAGRSAMRATATPFPSAAPRVVVVAGGESSSVAAQHLAERLTACGHDVGVADGVGARSERALLGRRHDVAILATTRALLLDTGLGTTRCDVAAVLGPLRDERDPLQLPLEIAVRSLHIIDPGPPLAAAAAIAELMAGI